jgi:protein-tyrosine phosphatase
VTGRLAPRQPDAAAMRAAMIAMYRELPRWMVPRLQGFLGCVVDGRMPVVVHCSAGKDRTGFAVAVLLSALGVHRNEVMQDYLYTNEVGDLDAFIQRRYVSRLGVSDGRRPLSGMTPEVRRVLLAADADYLQAALAEVEAEFGGLTAYLQQAVGLAPAQLARLQAVLLA